MPKRETAEAVSLLLPASSGLEVDHACKLHSTSVVEELFFRMVEGGAGNGLIFIARVVARAIDMI